MRKTVNIEFYFQEAATSTQSASSDSSSNEEKMMITISTSEAGELIIADPLDSWTQIYLRDDSENLLSWVYIV